MTPTEEIQHLHAECDRLQKLLAEAHREIGRIRRKNVQGTHWEGCWRYHHECAIAKIERCACAINMDTAIG